MEEPSISPPYTDFRSRFEQDYGRAVFATPVRRLQDKAQVFPLEPIDAVRTRLTHSMEVSSVARSVTRKVLGELKDDWLDENKRYDVETIAATCGLLHDIGNPPFGHFGEKAIRSWFKDSDLLKKIPKEFALDFECFEGNAQTIRLVTRLQVLSDFRGLNLTAGTLSALLKYTATADSINSAKDAPQSQTKPGFFKAELPEISKVQKATGTGSLRNPIAQLVEASDDLVYLTVDLEDAVKKNVVRWNDFEETLRGLATDVFEDVEKFKEECGKLHTGASLGEAQAQFFRTAAIRCGAKAVSDCFVSHYDQIMDGSWDRELLYVSDRGKFFEAIKDFSIKNIYNSKETVRLEVLGHNVLHDLLRLFSKADIEAKPGTFERKLYDLLSRNYRSVYEQTSSDLDPQYARALLLTDYICGMTDTFAVRLHRDLMQGQL